MSLTVSPEEEAAGGKWQPGQRVQVVEHVDATRKPKEGGAVYPAEVLRVAGPYVIADIPALGEVASFWVLSGWTAWDAMFRWRLMPLPEEAGDY